MKAVLGLLVLIGGAAFVTLMLTLLYATCYGLYLAFSASVILGIIALFVEPLPLIIGLFEIFAHRNIAEDIVKWFNHLN